MTKMRYGPRGQTIASARGGYDEVLAKDLRQQAARWSAIRNAMPLHKKELMAHNSAKAVKKLAAKRKAAREPRMEAEQRMVEAVRQAVAILEFAMTDMMQHRLVGRRLVVQEAIHNTIYTLRTKCGVTFEQAGEYSRRIEMDRLHVGNAGRSDMDIFERSAEQFFEEQSRAHAARDEAARRVKDRLLARTKR